MRSKWTLSFFQYIRGFLIMIYILKDDGIFLFIDYKKRTWELPRNGISHIPPVLKLLTGYNPAVSMEADELTLQGLIGWRGRIAGNRARKMTKGIDEKWRKPDRIHFTQLSQQHYKYYMIHWPYIEVKKNSFFFSWVCVYSMRFQNKRNNNVVVPQPYPGYFMSCIVFKLPSSIAVVGVPLQLFLLAVCWQNNSCYCSTRIDFHRTAPSKAYLQATTLQQNINVVSFSAFLRRKKMHFQQSSTWDVIYLGHIEDKMLIFKGLNLSSISPSPTNREKVSCPQVLPCKEQNLKTGVCVFYQELYREGTFFSQWECGMSLLTCAIWG